MGILAFNRLDVLFRYKGNEVILSKNDVKTRGKETSMDAKLRIQDELQAKTTGSTIHVDLGPPITYLQLPPGGVVPPGWPFKEVSPPPRPIP